ncbi:hypothetical protein G7046_g3638 [Stylonectria norvegica]|nr:hypothetical protein G7046_g3638 [Stylonectria norvegica]
MDLSSHGDPSVYHSIDDGFPPPQGAGSSNSFASLAFPQSSTTQNITGHGAQMHSSKTWTTSSGEMGLLSDTDEVEDRSLALLEYNRLAKKHGLRLMVVEGVDPVQPGEKAATPHKRRWFYRILRSTSSQSKTAPKPTTRHKRSVSDIAHHFMRHRREQPQTIDIQAMIRLSGKSLLYLPTEYAPCALVLPTCLRATAHYLAQHVGARGIFRINGAVRDVDALFDYYCYTAKGGRNITNTVRSANLPNHIPASTQTVASTFKRLLSVIPGGILGSLSIYDALVAIHTELQGDPEFPRTKQTKLRARLIALALDTVRSQFRKETICGVFGLLSLLGRYAEMAPREDEEGRPLPTSDLMGYHALGIVFGPLLVGDLLDQYTPASATPEPGLGASSLSPQKLKQHCRKPKVPENEGIGGFNKVLVANDIAEMLVTNWRDIVRQMKSLGIHRRKEGLSLGTGRDGSLRQSTSESFVIRKPAGWDQTKCGRRRGRGGGGSLRSKREDSPDSQTPTLNRTRQRPKRTKSVISNRVGRRPSAKLLSPTAEESVVDDNVAQTVKGVSQPPTASINEMSQKIGYQELMEGLEGANVELASGLKSQGLRNQQPAAEPLETNETSKSAGAEESTPRSTKIRTQEKTFGSPHLSLEDVPARTSSKPRFSGESAHRDSPDQRWREDVVGTMEVKAPHSIERRKAIRRKQGGRERRHETSHGEVTGESHSQTPDSSRESLSKNLQLARATDSEDRLKDQGETEISGSPQGMRSVKIHTSNKPASPLGGSQNTNSTKPENTPQDHIGFSDRSSTTSATPPSHHHDYIFIVHHDDVKQPSTAASSEPPASDPIPRNSFSPTPIQFYSPMRVPPSLAAKTPESDASLAQEKSFTRAADLSDKEDLGDVARRATRQYKGLNGFTQQLSPLDSVSGGSSQSTKTMVLDEVALGKTRHKNKEKPAIRTSVADAENKQGAVKAMAAKFEVGESSKESSPIKSIPESRTQSLVTHFSQGSPNKSIQSPRGAESAWAQQSARKPSSSSQHQLSSRKSSALLPGEAQNIPDRELRTSISDSVAMRAAALKAERHAQMESQAKDPIGLVRSNIPPRKLLPEDAEEPSLRSPPSLGTMVPHPEQPPIAQYLNLIRPSSSASNIRQDPEFLGLLAHTPTPRPSSTTLLHAQIRNLQRQLDSKTEESVQLRRQLEAQEDAGTEVGTLSQQLREAKREAQMWRERAEAAERRVKVFERFTARLRGIREAAAAADSRDIRPKVTNEPSQDASEDDVHHYVKARDRQDTMGGDGHHHFQSRGKQETLNDGHHHVKVRDRREALENGGHHHVKPRDRQETLDDVPHHEKPHDGQRPRLPQTRRIPTGSTETTRSNISDKTEDTGVMTARIRKALHGGSVRMDGTANSPLSILGRLPQDDGPSSPKATPARDVSQSAVEIWMAAQELLCLEDAMV